MRNIKQVLSSHTVTLESKQYISFPLTQLRWDSCPSSLPDNASCIVSVKILIIRCWRHGLTSVKKVVSRRRKDGHYSSAKHVLLWLLRPLLLSNLSNLLSYCSRRCTLLVGSHTAVRWVLTALERCVLGL